MSKIKSNCANCGKEILLYSYQIKRAKNNFCSVECSRSFRKKQTKKYLCHCANCDKEWYIGDSRKRGRIKEGYTKEFCSTECYREYTASKPKICEFCKKEFKSYDKNAKHCSVECYHEHKKIESLINPATWYENGYKVIYAGNGNGIKEHIKIMEDHIGRKINRIEEVVHHINGIKDDNRLDNLQLLKRSEHTRLHREQDIEEGRPLFGR